MKSCLSLLLSAALLVSLTACGDGQNGSTSQSVPSSSSEETVSQSPVDTPFSLPVYLNYSLHPVLAANRANLTLAPLLYEPLFQVNGAFEAEPVLCQSYSVSEDGLIWTFRLRANITFSDGTPLTGEVVAAALEAARTPGTRYAQRLANVTAILAEEDCVILTLSQPNGRLPLLLDIPIALGEIDRPTGTGPYVLSGTQDAPVLTARGDWWQNASRPADQIPLRPISKSDDLIFSFSSGDAALVDVDLMGTNALGYSGNYETWDYATTDLIYVGFNTASGLCRTAAVRQVLATAINRDAITQTVYANHAAATALPVHPASSLYNPEDDQALAYAPEQLAQRLEDLRLTGRTLRLLVNSENTAKVSAAKVIAYQLESAGMEVDLQQLSFEAYCAALRAGTFDLYLGETVLTADFDLSALLSPDGALNYSRWTSEEILPLLAALSAAPAGSEAAAARTLFAHLNEQVPIAPVCFKNGSVLTQWGRLTGLSPVRNNVFYHLDGWIME